MEKKDLKSSFGVATAEKKSIFASAAATTMRGKSEYAVDVRCEKIQHTEARFGNPPFWCVKR
jgi:hypothetical protein